MHTSDDNLIRYFRGKDKVIFPQEKNNYRYLRMLLAGFSEPTGTNYSLLENHSLE